MISPLLQNEGIAEFIVENPWEYNIESSVPINSETFLSNSVCTSK